MNSNNFSCTVVDPLLRDVNIRTFMAQHTLFDVVIVN